MPSAQQEPCRCTINAGSDCGDDSAGNARMEMPAGLDRRADHVAAARHPLGGKFFLDPVLRETRLEAFEDDRVEILILIEAGEDVADFSRRRIALRLEALRADLLHHALHRRVDRADAALRRL